MIKAITQELENFLTEINKPDIPEDKYKRTATDVHRILQNQLEDFQKHPEQTSQQFFEKVKNTFEDALPKFDEGTTLKETFLNFFIHIANFFRKEENQIGLYRPQLDPVVKQAHEALERIQSAPESHKSSEL